MEDKEYMTRREAASLIRVSDQTVDNRIKDGDIAVVRIGRRVLIPRESLEQYMERCRAEAVARRRDAETKDKGGME